MLETFKDVKSSISANDKDALAITLATGIGSWVAQVAIKYIYKKAVIDKRPVVEID